MEKCAVDLEDSFRGLRYYYSNSVRPSPINYHNIYQLDLTYTDSLLAVF